MSQELYCYLNGKVLKESQAAISPFDRGFLWGDGVYEITPCFNRHFYRLADHLDHLYRSLRYVRIDFRMSREEIEKLTLDLLNRNLPHLAEEGIFRVGHWVTRGLDTPSMLARSAGPPTLFIFFRPVDGEAVARSLADGVKLSIVPTRRIPPQCVETRAKVTSKLNQILAELDADAVNTLSLMLDIHGRVTENAIANFFIVKQGVLWTPPAENILEGITRAVVFELSSRLKIPVEERHFTLYDLTQSEEFFLTSSVTCVTPVREVHGIRPMSPVPGPVTKRLIRAFTEETGFDFSRHL
ncbi:MAG: aminotransferase class IV [Thermodesulfobacteriota bacterium]|nr:aminotransferase class IV [Thermodesulfobacteriota bacterium]